MYHISNIVHKLFQSPLSQKSSDNEQPDNEHFVLADSHC